MVTERLSKSRFTYVSLYQLMVCTYIHMRKHTANVCESACVHARALDKFVILIPLVICRYFLTLMGATRFFLILLYMY